MFEIYEYEVDMYDPYSREGGFFADFINTFLKLKAEANGYPIWVRTLENAMLRLSMLEKTCGVIGMQ
jgi:hypothetical protein